MFFGQGGGGPVLPLSRENGFAKGSGDGPGGVQFEARRLSDRRDHDAVDDVHHAVRLADVAGFDIALVAAHVGERDHGADEAERQRRSEEHTSELQSLMRISYAVFCLKKKKYSS